ncbi:hypothetical protein Tco_1066852 [Tanacetum coccineum]|uniref:Uncharacterized protein n=1 Tax=Tanacetum coccineum TaxID=301880 RepID=A0ABQ5HBT4_9ASTR
MDNLRFCDKHNKVAFLKKPTESEGFTQAVDFLKDATGINNLSNAKIYERLGTLRCSTRTRSPIRQEPEIPQSQGLTLTFVVDETTFISVEVETERATTTTSGLDARLDSVPKLESKIRSLKKELKDTKQTFGNALLTLVKKVKSLEVALKRKSKKIKGSASEEVQEEDISPTTLEAAVILSKVVVQKTKLIDKGKRYKRRKVSKEKEVDTGLDFDAAISTGFEDIKSGYEDISTGFKDDQEVNTSFNGVNTGSLEVNTGIKLEEASLAKAIRLDALEKEEIAKQVHLDALLAKRMIEEQELAEQQKQRRAQEKVTEAKEKEPTKKIGKRRKQIARKGLHTNKDETEKDEDSDEDDHFSGIKVLINPIPVATRSPSIANYKIIKQGRKGVYQIVRANGSNKVYIRFGAMLKDISRDDLIELYRIVMQRYRMNGLDDDYEKVFWGNLKTMFDASMSTDAIWSLPGQQKIINWVYYDVCRVHCLNLDSAEIYMLTERSYRLSAKVCKAMLDKKLQGAKKNEDSGVTYTELSSPYDGLSDIRSPRANEHEHDGVPWMLDDPYAQVIAQAPPSPDYMPGPEEPDHALPSPDYVPGLEHDDDEIVAEDQPYADDATPIADSPRYVPESDHEADPEEEDPIEYHADGGDDGDDEMDIEEDEDNVMDIEASKEEQDDDMDIEAKEEEEHPAPADSVVVALPATDPSAEETEPFETDESAVTPPPHPAYRMTARITIPEPVPLPAWTNSEVARLLAISSPPASPLSP